MKRLFTELALGMRMAVAGGRRGWTRTAMAAAGVGLGTAVLLIGASVPVIVGSQNARVDARNDLTYGAQVQRGDTVLVAAVESAWNGTDVRGRLLWPESARSSLPPGVAAFPADRQAYVSPALREALAGPNGDTLREQMPYQVVGIIADAGLSGPHELAYYAGYEELENHVGQESWRVATFGSPEQTRLPVWNTYLIAASMVATLLLPVTIFVGAALRFGADTRDRRMAAIRLVGADRGSTLRIALGESLVPAVIGLAAGAVLFALARSQAERLVLFDTSGVYPPDVRPVPYLAVLVVAGVLALAAGTTLLALRGAVIEPLGVVRRSVLWNGRLWWRLLPVAAGLVLVAPAFTEARTGSHDEGRIGAGVIVLIIALIPLAPYLVPLVAARLPSGPISWQLASRQLRQNPVASTRSVTGIMVAVTGAIGLYSLFAAGTVQREVRDDPADPAYSVVSVSGTIAPQRLNAAFEGIEGIQVATTTRYNLYDVSTAGSPGDLVIGDCAALGRLAKLDRCTDGDVFVFGVAGGEKVTLQADGDAAAGQQWTVPRRSRPVTLIGSRAQNVPQQVLVTVGAAPTHLPETTPRSVNTEIYLEPGASPQIGGRLRAAAAGADPLLQVNAFIAERDKFSAFKTGLNIGSTVVLLLMGLGLLLDVADRLHDRRRLLGVLAAVGAKRSTVIWSVLHQALVPVFTGLLLAVVAGTGLGAALMRMSKLPVRFNVAAILAPIGIGTALVLLTTVAVLLPAVHRVTKTEQLRYE